MHSLFSMLCPINASNKVLITINTFLLTFITMIAFAANSVFGRVALGGATGSQGLIDPASYSLIRLVAGAVALVLLVTIISHKNSPKKGSAELQAGSWLSGGLLFGYSVFFSFSYVAIDTGIGALILFACVQGTMIGWGLFKGDRPSLLEWIGLLMAFGAFIWLVSPGLAAPDPFAALLMAISGVCWGAYSLRGRNAANPLRATAGNFVRSIPLAVLTLVFFATSLEASMQGAMLAIASGAVTSGMGYALWYKVLKSLSGTRAAIVQLTVPVIAGFGGALTLGEPFTARFVLASLFILGGVAIAILAKANRNKLKAV